MKYNVAENSATKYNEDKQRRGVKTMKKCMLGFGAFLIIFIAVCWRNNTIVYGEPDVKNSMSFNREQHLTVIAYRNKIEDKEAFAEELIQMCKDNSFKTIKFSTDRGYATGIYMNVYLTEKDWKNGKKVMEVEYTQGPGKLEYDIINNPEEFELIVK